MQVTNKLGLLMMQRFMRCLLGSMLIATLAACGVGGEREPVPAGPEVINPPVTTTVANQPPVGSFTPTANGLTVTFNASASSDPDGTILGYQWNFGDGTTVLNTTSATVTHVYANSGTFMVNLIVLDSRGTVSSVVSQNISVAPIPVANKAPEAQFTVATVLDNAAGFNATLSTDIDGTITSYAWNFGEPLSNTNTATGNSATHVYGRTGSFVVTLTVTDNGGLTASSTQTVNIGSFPNVNPVPQIAVTPDALLVTFNASRSTDNGGTITNYSWNFGDSNSTTNTATGVTTTHGYKFAGSYTVTLVVTDDRGASVTTARGVIVSTPVAIATGQLNDTGITASQCYQAGTDTLVLCSSALAIGTVTTGNIQALPVTTFAPQDGMTGRDSDTNTNTAIDGQLGFSFTKIGAFGEALPANATTWSCVKDNVTGLMWENKTNDSSLNNIGRAFTNYDSTVNPQLANGGIPTQADIDAPTNSIGFRNAINAQGLCGATDWRLPEINEIRSVWNYGAANSARIFDTAWFNWGIGTMTNSNYIAYSGANGALFQLGNDSIRPRGAVYLLILVRGALVNPPASRFVVSVDGQEVRDNTTGLIWQRCPIGMIFRGGFCNGTATNFSTHEAALNAAAAVGGVWQMPNVKELASIVDFNTALAPAIDTTAFPDTPGNAFWSSTPEINPQQTWIVTFAQGFVPARTSGRSVTAPTFLRLVQTGCGSNC